MSPSHPLNLFLHVKIFLAVLSLFDSAFFLCLPFFSFTYPSFFLIFFLSQFSILFSCSFFLSLSHSLREYLWTFRAVFNWVFIVLRAECDWCICGWMLLEVLVLSAVFTFTRTRTWGTCTVTKRHDWSLNKQLDRYGFVPTHAHLWLTVIVTW